MQRSTVNTSSKYYDASYFAWQSPGGVLGAQLDLWKFRPFTASSDVVLDFGCGGGYLLAALPCRSRYGVEVNASARTEASRTIEVYSTVEELPLDVQFDVIISHHALEHIEAPLDALQKLRERLRPGGRAVFVVPSESWQKGKHYRANDINQHLYTWTPLILGNLFAHAGYSVERCELLRHRWLPKAGFFSRVLSQPIFHFLCRAWGTVARSRQIRIVASNPNLGLANGAKPTSQDARNST
jgi:SAM-dependent methyltransferase